MSVQQSAAAADAGPGHDLGNAARLGGLELRIGIAMPLTTPTVSTDAAKLAALRRVKLIAAALLAICVAVFAAAKLLEPRWPGWASSPPSPRRRRSAASPTGTRWWRCSAARSACPFRTPPSSRPTRTASPTISAASSRSISWPGAGPPQAQGSRLRRPGRRLAEPTRPGRRPVALRRQAGAAGARRRRAIGIAGLRRQAADGRTRTRSTSRRWRPDCSTAFTDDRPPPEAARRP